MMLYHGTSESAARRALKEGLVPRGRRKSNWKMASGSDRVYLTDAYALYFAVNATDVEKERVAVVEINPALLDISKLVPDEDYLEQVTRKNRHLETSELKGSMKVRTRLFREHAKAFQTAWRESMKRLGTCAYMGAIPPEAITRIALYNPASNPTLTLRAMDPTITLLNYLHMGESYRALTQWLFGPVEPRDLFGPTYDLFWKDKEAEVLEILNQRDGIEIITRENNDRP